MKESPPAGLILAGGQSSRFGSDKAMVPVDGSPMLHRVHDAVAAVATPVLIGVADAGTAYDLPVRHVADRYPGRGPLGGLHAGLLAAPAEWLLVAPCDMPYLTTAALRKLLAARPPDGDAVVARGAGGLVPVLGCYHRRCLARIEARLTGDDVSLHGLMDTLTHTTVRLGEDVLRNVNAPEDIAG